MSLDDYTKRSIEAIQDAMWPYGRAYDGLPQAERARAKNAVGTQILRKLDAVTVQLYEMTSTLAEIRDAQKINAPQGGKTPLKTWQGRRR